MRRLIKKMRKKADTKWLHRKQTSGGGMLLVAVLQKNCSILIV